MLRAGDIVFSMEEPQLVIQYQVVRPETIYNIIYSEKIEFIYLYYVIKHKNFKKKL
jgi:hypothetical protein